MYFCGENPLVLQVPLDRAIFSPLTTPYHFYVYFCSVVFHFILFNSVVFDCVSSFRIVSALFFSFFSYVRFVYFNLSVVTIVACYFDSVCILSFYYIDDININ